VQMRGRRIVKVKIITKPETGVENT